MWSKLSSRESAGPPRQRLKGLVSLSGPPVLCLPLGISGKVSARVTVAHLCVVTWGSRIQGPAGQRPGQPCTEGGSLSRQGPPAAPCLLKSRVTQVEEGGRRAGSGDSCPGRCALIWREDGCGAQGWPHFSPRSLMPTCTWCCGVLALRAEHSLSGTGVHSPTGSWHSE